MADTCSATRDLTDAPWHAADGTLITTAACELDAHDDTTPHAAYLDGRTTTVTIPVPATHTWSTAPATGPGVCDTCGMFVADNATHAEWHRTLGG